jgi:hypothetical protein
MTNIAILGIKGAHLDKEERDKAFETIVMIHDKFQIPNLKLMTMKTPHGGINAMVESFIQTNKVNHELYSFGKTLEDWKESSKLLAENCDILFVLTTGIKKEKCHHCFDFTHETTGGCFAMKRAKELGKQTKLIIL